MNSLHLYLAIGLGVVGAIVIAVIWSLRRMPSEAELEALDRRQSEEAVRAGTEAKATAANASIDR